MTRRHPVSLAMRAAMEEHQDLTVLATFHPPAVRAEFGPDRMITLPIAENAMVGIATGQALAGQRTMVNIGRAAFLYTAMDPVVNQATKWRYMSGGQFHVPLTIRGLTRGGENLGAQHEHVPHALLSQIPGLVVAVPASPNSAAGLLTTALRHPDPVVILESPQFYTSGWESLPEPEATPSPLPFGTPNAVGDGRDVILVGIGNTVRLAMTAAAALGRRNRFARVIDLRTAAPVDIDRLASEVVRASCAVLVDEAPPACSLMRDIACQLMLLGAVQPDRIRVLDGASCPAPVSPHLQARLSLTADHVLQAALDILPTKKAHKGRV
ncbi:alpha-ketoacid dehydrogenase subunit beta [Amycolatopsis sp. NPDC054798]